MHVMRMCPALARLGHAVELHVPRGEAAAIDDYAYYGAEPTFRIVKHQRFKIRVAGAVIYAAGMAAHFALRERPDLFYARDIFSLAAVATLGVPFCLESHWQPKNALQRQVEARLLRSAQCQRVVLISEALRAIYRQTFPWFPAEKLVVAHDAADLQPGANATPQSQSARLQVGYVGSFFSGYGVELLPRLAERLPQHDFHIVGGDPDAVVSLRAANAQLSNLTFHGFVQPSRLAETYAGFDVVVAPYQPSTPHIGWISPMKLFEYMAHAKPIICADFGVMREILTDNHDALLVPAQDLEMWVLAIQRMQDPELRQRLASNALEHLQAHHTWDIRARHVMDGMLSR